MRTTRPTQLSKRTVMGAATLVALMLGVLLVPIDANAASQNEIQIEVIYDGTPGFSDPAGSTTMTGTVPEPHTAGSDAGPNNGVVRTHDLYAMRVDWNINEDLSTGNTVTVVLPDHSTWTPDASGMFAGCDPLGSSISADGHTLICDIGVQPEGSNGTFRPIATLNLSLIHI